MTAVDVLTLGETMVAMRTPARWAHGGTAHVGVAGAETNVAIGLSRLGHSTRWVSRLGDDPFGEAIRAVLAAESVDTTYVSTVPDRNTGLLFSDTGPWGRRSTISADDVRPALLDGARAVHVTGITPALGQGPAEAVITMLRFARDHGWLTSLDVNYRSTLWTRDDAAVALRPLLPWIDLLIASDDELSIVGDDVDAVAAQVGRVAIKHGRDGAGLVAGSEHDTCAAFAVNVVDPVGAGDAFSAGLLSGLLDGLDDATSLQRGCALGAAATAARDDWSGLPLRTDLPTDLADLDPEDSVR